MSYKIEINADSLSELGGKLLALASQFHAQPVGAPAIDPVMPEVREAEDKPKRARKAKAEEPQEDVGNAAQSAEPTMEPTAAETAETTTDGTTTSDAPADAEPAAPKGPLDGIPAGADPEDYVEAFEEHVAPVVIDAVGQIGKEAVSGVLSQFGAARAREVDPAQWGELVDALKAKL